MARRATAPAVAPAAAPGAGPRPDCALCPRLAAFRGENRTRHPEFHNAPVASFGGRDARLLIVGLAPGLKGANRTGRPFTGDYAGDLLYPTLLRFGFARGIYGRRPDDGLELLACRITNAVRCVPPGNKPTTEEIRTCGAFLKAELEALPGLRAVLALGAVAHGAVLAALGIKKNSFAFAHGAMHDLPGGLLLADSYHCSRYNTNTGRLSVAMFEAVFVDLRRRLG
ncbi:MAG: uracil-DNA glycosylase [Kiloniellaceae bacterium]